MCKNCNKIREIKDLEIKEYMRTINAWKHRCWLQEKVLQQWCKRSQDWLYPSQNDRYEQLWLQEQTNKVISPNYVGR